MNRYNNSNGSSNHSVGGGSGGAGGAGSGGGGGGGYRQSSRNAAAAGASGDEPLSKTNVFIRGLSAHTNDEDLYNMCNKFGPIVSSKSITDRMTNECKGYGFVNFENPGDAANAVRELSNCGYQARMSKENMARSDRSFGRRSPPEYNRSNGGQGGGGGGPGGQRNSYGRGRPALSKTNLYLRGLDVGTSDDDLHQLCTRYGNILSAKAIIDRTTNECKGYGFVNFDSEYAAEAAIADLSQKGYQVSMSRENRNGGVGGGGMSRQPIAADGPGNSWH